MTLAVDGGSIPAPTNARLPVGIRPLRYDLSLGVDPRQATFSGKTRIAIAVDVPTDTIVLHARAMTAIHATVDHVGARALPRFAFGGKEEPEELVLQLASTLTKGEHAIEIEYTAPFNTHLRGLYKVEQGGKSWAFTQLEAVDARRMFPSFDEPRFKTPFHVVVAAPTGMTVVSNYPLEKQTTGSPLSTWDFQPTLPLPTYLVALAVGDLEITDGPKEPVPIRLVSVPGRGKLGALSLEAAAAYLKILGAYFDRPYPYPKLDIAAVPDFGPGAMENAGLVTFRDELLLLDPKQAPMWARRRMEGVMAHELAHQWFGDLVTMPWWDEIWLNEGFATWMASKAVAERRPEMRTKDDLVGAKLNVMVADALGSARPVRIPVDTSDQILESGGWNAYVKGGSLLAMLESHVGETPFRDGIRAYVKAHEFGTVTSDDLIASLSKATNKDLSSIAKAFLDQTGVPTIDVVRTCDAKGARLRLNVAPTRVATSPAENGVPRAWPIPVCLRAEGAAQPICLRVEPGGADVALPKCSSWVEPNAGEKGYYRYRLAPAMLLALATERSLSDIERAALLSNTWALVLANQLSAFDAMDLLARMELGRDSSRLVLDQVIGMLAAVREALVDDAITPKFRSAVSRLLSPALARLGEDPRPNENDDDRGSRVAVTGALFDLAADARVAATAEKRVRAFLADPKSVDPDLAALALRISSRAGGAAGPQILHDRLAKADPSDRVAIVSALASTGDPKALEAALGWVLSGEIRGGDFRYFFTGTSRQPDSRVVFTDWTMAHLDELAKHLGGVGGLASLVGWACDRPRQQKVAQFFQSRIDRLEGARRSLDEGLETSELCIRVREQQKDAASKWLAR